MSTSKRKVVPDISATSPVPELITFLRHAFQPHEFSEVEEILINRENGLKMELEKLRKDNEELKEKHDLMEKKHGLAELAKLKFENDLRESKRVCDQLRKKIFELNEDYEVMVEEKRQMLLVAEKEKSKIMSEFSEKIKVLEGEKLDLVEKMEVYSRRFEEANEKISKLECVIKKVKGIDVRAFGGEGNAGEEETYFTASEGGKKSSDTEIPPNGLNVKVKVEDETLESPVLDNGADVGLTSSKVRVESDSSRNGSVDSRKEGLHPTDLACNIGFPTETQIIYEVGISNKLYNQIDQLGSAPIIININDSDDDMPTHGTTCVSNIEATNLGEKHMTSVNPVKIESSSLENEKIERYCGDSSHINTRPKRKLNSSESEDDDNIPLSKQKPKLVRELTDNGKWSLSNLASDVAEAVSPSLLHSKIIKQCNEKAGTMTNPRLTSTKSFTNRVDESCDTSASSEGVSYVESYVNKVIADFERGRENIWKYTADMLAAFMRDPELCMNAVCALYRQQNAAQKSIKTLSPYKGGGFKSFDVSRGTAVAKYLINDDPENRLSRSVSEVREKHPDMLDTCERFAIQYSEELFDIYRKKLDPFFCPNL